MKQHFLEQGINCIRTGLQATEDLDDDTQVLAGAYTPAMGELVDTRRYGRQLLSFLRSCPMNRQSPSAITGAIRPASGAIATLPSRRPAGACLST